MPRTARRAPGGMIFHVLNRGVRRQTLFHKDQDYAAFERVVESTLERNPIRLLAYCLMPNHWHLLLWPQKEGDLAAFMQRLTITHAKRWQHHNRQNGWGHVYQGRFKSFPVQEDEHFLTVARYVERNPLRGTLVRRAENWRWSSLWVRERGSDSQRQLLADWPVPRPRDYLKWVNEPQTGAEMEAMRVSIEKGRPFGSEKWQRQVARRLNLETSFRDAGRPKVRKN